MFGQFGFDEGLAGHITARDPELPDHFWVNPLGMNFKLIRVKDLILVNDRGEVVDGNWPVNAAAFAIHSQIHAARPDVVAAAHAHSVHGKAWSSLRRPLDPLTQDSCAFYGDHAVFDDYTGVVLDLEEGKRIAHALGGNKALILANHGLLTVGQTSVDEAAWWFITMERTCQAQLLAEAAGDPVLIDHRAGGEDRAPGGTADGRMAGVPTALRVDRDRPARAARGVSAVVIRSDRLAHCPCPHAKEVRMIFVVVKQPVRAKYADDFPSLVEEFTAATRAEPGNISFDWYRSAEDPNLWVLIEVYRDRESGDAHVALGPLQGGDGADAPLAGGRPGAHQRRSPRRPLVPDGLGAGPGAGWRNPARPAQRSPILLAGK